MSIDKINRRRKLSMKMHKGYVVIPSQSNPNIGLVKFIDEGSCQHKPFEEKIYCQTFKNEDGFIVHMERIEKDRYTLHASHSFNHLHDKISMTIEDNYDGKGKSLICSLNPLDVDDFLYFVDDDEFLLKICILHFYVSLMGTLMSISKKRRIKNIILFVDNDYIENLECYDLIVSDISHAGPYLTRMDIPLNGQNISKFDKFVEKTKQLFPQWLWEESKNNINARRYMILNPCKNIFR